MKPSNKIKQKPTNHPNHPNNTDQLNQTNRKENQAHRANQHNHSKSNQNKIQNQLGKHCKHNKPIQSSYKLPST
jgi:hypothetical protein